MGQKLDSKGGQDEAILFWSREHHEIETVVLKAGRWQMHLCNLMLIVSRTTVANSRIMLSKNLQYKMWETHSNHPGLQFRFTNQSFLRQFFKLVLETVEQRCQ